MFLNEHFINEVRFRPVLWDPNHVDFNHRQAKQSAWEEVAANVYSDSETWSRYDKFAKVREIQKRWKNLRDSYNRDMKYQKKVDKGLAMAKKKQYVYSHLMSFLNIGKKPAKRQSSSSEGSSSEEETDRDADHEMTPNQKATTSMQRSMKTEDVEHIVVKPDQNCFQGFSSSQDDLRNSSHTFSTFPDMRQETYATEMSGLGRNSMNCAMVVPQEPVETDDDKLFLLSLLPYFKKLDSSQKLPARIEVMKTIHNLIYKQK